MDHILKIIASRADEVAYICPEGIEVSSIHWVARIKKIMLWLKSNNVLPADRVGIYMPNSPDYVSLVISIWSLGATAVLIPYNYPQSAADQLAQTAKVSFIITDTKKDLDNVIVFNIQESSTDKIITPIDKGSQDALVIFTSGTQGPPKGVVLTIDNLLFSAQGSIDFFNVQANDIWQVTLSLWHIGGIMIPIRALLARAKFSFAKDLNSCPPDFMSLVPAQLYNYLDNPKKHHYLKRQKAILLGGAPCSKWPLERANELKLPIVKTYGMTEMTAQITCTLPGSDTVSQNCGKLLPYRQLKIDSSGKIKVKGETRFRCYLEDGKEVYPFDQFGFFTTSDLGRFDQDGNLEILGRSDQCFISGGENINPIQLENEIIKIGGVLAAYVVPYTHQEFGQVSAVFIKVKNGLKIDIEYINRELKKRVPAFMVPKMIVEYPFSDEIKPNRDLLKKYIYDIL